jgi:hypothetical protein
MSNDDRKAEARRMLEEAMRRSGTNPFAQITDAFGTSEAQRVMDAVTGKVADRIDDARGRDRMRVIGDMFAGLAREARALRMRMEGT